MAASFVLSLILLLLSLSSFSSAALLLNAAEILWDSGHLSMALTLQLVYQIPLLSQSPTSTIFAPSNAAFVRSGQPSLNQLRYHFTPLLLPIETLKTLPEGTIIPTYFFNHSLVITSNRSQISINNIKINETALFDDKRTLIIYGTDEFFNSSFQIPPISLPESVPAPAPNPNLITKEKHYVSVSSQPFGYYDEASEMLRSRGYNRMATFLDMQLVGNMDPLKLTIFAPVDREIDEFVKGNFSDYPWVFRQHVVPDWLTLSELKRVDDGTLLRTFSERFKLEVTRSGDVLEINSVPIIFPDMYYSDWLVVHGLQSSLVWETNQVQIGESFYELNGDIDQSSPDSDYWP